MGYNVILSPEAESQFRSYTPFLQSHLAQEIKRLADNPTRLSRPAVMPYPANSQVFHAAALEVVDIKHEFTIFFRYSQDETAIEVIAIGYIQRELDQ